MRDFVQPRVLGRACTGAAITTLMSLPRLMLWAKREYLIPYLLLVIFFCAVVLWGFVFAWHEKYTRRPVILFKISPKWFIFATIAGIVIAFGQHVFLDPLLRAKLPDEYPKTFEEWWPRVLFGLGMTELFLVFAPFDWAMRLSKRHNIALLFTLLLGVVVLVLKVREVASPIDPMVIATLAGLRGISTALAIQFYLQGGLFLTCWCAFLIETRHLLFFR